MMSDKARSDEVSELLGAISKTLLEFSDRTGLIVNSIYVDPRVLFNGDVSDYHVEISLERKQSPDNPERRDL